MTEDQLKNHFQEIEDNFNKAVITNDINEIKKYITSDWVLVDSQGGIIPQERFFSVLEQGLLSHSTMTKEILRVKLYTKWYLNSKNQIEYDSIEFFSDGYFNNAFVGIWGSYSNGNSKICNWDDYRVPNANKDFDIGVGEFNVSEKYWNKGWLDIAQKNQAQITPLNEVNGASCQQRLASQMQTKSKTQMFTRYCHTGYTRLNLYRNVKYKQIIYNFDS